MDKEEYDDFGQVIPPYADRGQRDPFVRGQRPPRVVVDPETEEEYLMRDFLKAPEFSETAPDDDARIAAKKMIESSKDYTTKQRIKDILENGTMSPEDYDRAIMQELKQIRDIDDLRLKDFRKHRLGGFQEEDLVNDPSHYNKGVEVLQYVESWQLNFSCGNAIKYITRSNYKGKKAEDLAKALFYIAFELEQAGGADAITKFANRWLSKKTMLTKKYVIVE